MADAQVGSIVATLSVDARAWQQGLQAASQQLTQFQAQLVQQTQQGASQAQQLGRAQAQAATAAAREQMQAARLASAEAITGARTASAERIQASRAASQAELLAFRQSTEAARQAFAQQREAARAAQAEARSASGGGGGILAGALSVAGGLGIVTGIGAVTSAIVALGRETVTTGAKLEQLRASLSAIGGGRLAGAEQFRFLLDTAQRLGVAFEPLAQGWRRLTAAATSANIPMDEQRRLFTAVAAESRRVGISSEELSRLLTGLGQVFSKGKLSAEEWRQQIGEALPSAMAALQRGTGRTSQEIDQLMSTGSIGITTFVGAFTRGLESIQQSSGKMAEGATTAFTRLKTSWQDFQDALANSGVNQYFGQVADNLREAVEWSTRLLKPAPGQGPVQGPTPQGPTVMGGTDVQQQEIRRLQGIIVPYSRLAKTAANPAHRAQYAEMVARTKEQLEQLYGVIGATKNQATAQAKVTAEVDKTTTAQGIQTDYVKDLRKAHEELRKAREAYNKEASLAPERMGKPGTGGVSPRAAASHGRATGSLDQPRRAPTTRGGAPSRSAARAGGGRHPIWPARAAD